MKFIYFTKMVLATILVIIFAYFITIVLHFS